MTSIALCHIGGSWPGHINTCIDHISRWYNGNIYVIINNVNISKINKQNNNVNIIEIESLNSDLLKEFNKFDIFTAYGLNGFWRYAFERLLFLEAFMTENNIEEVIHIENDVLIYYDPKGIDYRSYFKDQVAFNPLGDNFCTASHIYIDNPRSLSIVNSELLSMIKLGTDKLSSMFPGIAPINEMILLSRLLKDNKIKYLPINTFGKYSDNFEDFNMIYDPASWGQYVGGTPIGHSPGALFDHHWIGFDMKSRSFEIRWKNDGLNRREPYFFYNGNEYKFANLHIHSKELYKYC